MSLSVHRRLVEAIGISSLSTSVRGYGPAAAITAWLLAAAYLGGGLPLVQFAVMVGGILLPGAALISRRLTGCGLTDELRVCTASAAAILCAMPVYYLRRAVPIPAAAFDLAVILAMLTAAIRTGALRMFVGEALSPAFRSLGWLVAGILPAAACLVRMGFEVRGGSTVRYHALSLVDFSNLATVVTMIKTSPGLPSFATLGSGFLHYHWWFFAFPAWLSELGGFDCRSATALALTDLLCSVLLAATIFAATLQHLRARPALAEPVRRRLAALTAGIVIVAPFSVYAYHVLVAALNLPWFTLGARSHLLLSVLNSMTSFGNHTLALTMTVLIAAMLSSWNEHPSRTRAALIGAGAIAIMGLSIILILPAAAAAATWLLLGRLRRPALLVGPVALVGAAGLVLLWKTNVLGDSPQHLVASFDRGQFVQNVVFGMAPIWVLVLSARAGGPPVFSRALIVAGIAVPTFLIASGPGTIPESVSMKIATLLAVSAAPLVADGILTVWHQRRVVWKLVAAATLSLGLANAAVYTLQFPAYRLGVPAGDRFAEMPANYIAALEYVREQTPRTAVVIDPGGDMGISADITVLVAERRLWLPVLDNAADFGVGLDSPEMTTRLAPWRAWKASRFRDESQAAILSAGADILIAEPHVVSAWWTELRSFGDFAVYAARRGAPDPARAADGIGELSAN